MSQRRTRTYHLRRQPGAITTACGLPIRGRSWVRDFANVPSLSGVPCDPCQVASLRELPPPSQAPAPTAAGEAMTPERLAELRTRLAPGTVILRSELREALDEVDRLTEVVRCLKLEPF